MNKQIYKNMKVRLFKSIQIACITMVCSTIFAFSTEAQTTTVTVQYGNEDGGTGSFSCTLPTGITNVNGELWGAGGAGAPVRACGYYKGAGTGYSLAAASGGAGGGKSSFNWGNISGAINVSVGSGGVPAAGGDNIECNGSYYLCIGYEYRECKQSGSGGTTTISRTGVSVSAGGGTGGKSAAADANGSGCDISYNSAYSAPGGSGNVGTGGVGGLGFSTRNSTTYGIGGAGGMGYSGGSGAPAATNTSANGAKSGTKGEYPGGGGSGGAASSRSGDDCKDGSGGYGANGEVLLNFSYFSPNTPVISSTLAGNNCFTSNVTLSIENNETTSGASYQWYKDNVALSGQTGISYTVTTPGVYKVGAKGPVGVSSIAFAGASKITISSTNDGSSVNGTTLNIGNAKNEQFSREITFVQQPTISIASPYQYENGTYYLFVNSKTVNLASGITANNGTLKFYASNQTTEVSSSLTITNATTEYYAQVLSVLAGCETAKHKIVVLYQNGISIWSPGNIDGSTMNDTEKTNYNDRRNWMQGTIPTSTSTVYIAAKTATGATIQHFPYLENGNTYYAQDIYLCSGAEIGNPQNLNYAHAHVQHNLGLGATTQQALSSNDINNLLFDNSYDHLQLSAALSAPPITRNKWHTFTASLKGMVSGDYTFGGVPRGFIRKFDANRVETGSAFKGNWTDTYTTNVEPLNPAEGFAVWINTYQNQQGYRETESNLNETAMGMSGRTVGLSQINGILEFPYHNNSYVLQFEQQQLAHRAHQATPNSDYSKFFSFHQDDLRLVDIGESVTRSNPTRFAFEGLSSYPIVAGTQSTVALVGNPYPSSIDFNSFLSENSGRIKNGYTLWTGGSFSTYGEISSGSVPINQYIAPGQSFLVELAMGVSSANLSFPATISIRKTSAINSSLRSDNAPSGLLNIEVSNAAGTVNTFIMQHEEGSVAIGNRDMSKILPTYNTLPEVYTLKAQTEGEMRGVATHFIPMDTEVLIPIGIATTSTGNLHFLVSGMNNFCGKISFIDMQTELENEISGLSQYVYDCDYTPAKNAKNETLACEDRFFLRISANLTGISDNLHSDLQIGVNRAESGLRFYANQNIQSIALYDMQGRLVSEKCGIHNSVYTLPCDRQIYIAKVLTEHAIRYLKVK